MASDPGSAVATGTTSADGGFSITLPDEQFGETLYAGSTGAPGLASAVEPLQLNVEYPTQISSLKVSLSQYWGLSVSGCLGVTFSTSTVYFYNTSGLTVQYASSPVGPWKKLGAINGDESGSYCANGGIKFTGSFTAPVNYAYYRVVYAGTSGAPTAATAFEPSHSGTVLAWRYADRITGYKVSPAVVNPGGKLTIKGTLQYYYGGWHNYSGQTIWIDLRPKGSSSWYWIVKVGTNSKGQFSATFKDPVSATWEAVFEGNNSNGVGHLSAGSPQIYVRLK